MHAYVPKGRACRLVIAGCLKWLRDRVLACESQKLNKVSDSAKKKSCPIDWNPTRADYAMVIWR